MRSLKNGSCSVVAGRVAMSDGVGSGCLDTGLRHLQMFREATAFEAAIAECVNPVLIE